MSASSSAAAAAGGVVVVTHVIPASQGAASPNRPEENRFRRQLVALGTAQIIIGLMDFLFGIIMLPHADTLAVYSGVFAWGALSFIIAGSLTVAAGKSLDRYRVNRALGFSVVALVASAAATIIYTLDALGIFIYYYDFYHIYQVRIRSVSGVLAVFSVLEFAVSICVIVIGCSASYQPTDQLIIIANRSHEAASQTPETPPTYEAPSTTPPPSDSGYEMVNPPEYNTAIV